MLKLPRALADAMRRHAERDYPKECCGVLLGQIRGAQREVMESRACANVFAKEGDRAGESARDRYSIAPAELIAVQREARARGLAIVGFYHSHPDHPAKPSARDLAEAYWPECSYVIVSVDAGASKELAAYRLEAEDGGRRQFVPEEIVIS